ncbi:MAG: flagellar hook-basal body complex protein FliE [Verrucomicrobium sp.]|nr:flagellar hook-basal body complex protein FliE [Verrucomicrobium sp.]
MDPLSAASALTSTPLDPGAAVGQAGTVLQQGNGATFAFKLPQAAEAPQASAAVSGPSQVYAAGAEPTTYTGIVQDMIRQTNQLDQTAGAKVRDVLMGGPTTVNDAMVAEEEAGVAFKLVSQVRNQVVSAYQEVMRMQI